AIGRAQIQTTHTSASAAVTAIPVSGPAGTATAAAGTSAPASTTRRRAAALPYAAIASGQAAAGTSTPIAAADAPKSMTGANSGTATRFAAGEMSEMRPKTAAAMGIVGIDAASVADSASPRTQGTRERRSARGR